MAAERYEAAYRSVRVSPSLLSHFVILSEAKNLPSDSAQRVLFDYAQGRLRQAQDVAQDALLF